MAVLLEAASMIFGGSFPREALADGPRGGPAGHLPRAAGAGDAGAAEARVGLALCDRGT
ncbi:MAG: hypothetical protein R3F43_19225 [bacterium]